jgi:hypothetical protein
MVTTAQVLAARGLKMILEDGPEILGEKSPEEEPGEDILVGLSPRARRTGQARIQARQNLITSSGGPATASGP